MMISLIKVEMLETCQATIPEKSEEVESVARRQSQTISRNRKTQIDAAMKSGNAKKQRKWNDYKLSGMLRNKANGNLLTRPIRGMPQRCKRRMKRN